MAQVHIRLSEDDKEEWREYAESEGYGSLSRFIRMAVANEKSEDSRPTDSGDVKVSVPDNVATTDELNRINDSLLKVVDRLENMDGRLEQLERDRVRPSDTKAVLEALPTKRPTPKQIEEGWTKDRDPDYENPNAGTAFDGTPESVAKVTNESVAAVQHFLAQASQRTDGIRMEEMEGKVRYWKEENDE